jgi:dCMP deaminase
MEKALSITKSSNEAERPSWDDYFFEIADTVSKRATCNRGKSGCVIVKDKRILVTGFVGSPSGFPHCDDIGHQMKKLMHENGHVTEHCMRTIHAEQNAICQAARQGISLDGATLYTRMTPCRTCAMLIINCGIKKVFCERKYHAGSESESMFIEAGIQFGYKYQEIQQYQRRDLTSQ